MYIYRERVPHSIYRGVIIYTILYISIRYLMNWTLPFVGIRHAGDKSVHLVAGTPNSSNDKLSIWGKSDCVGQNHDHFFNRVNTFGIFGNTNVHIVLTVHTVRSVHTIQYDL